MPGHQVTSLLSLQLWLIMWPMTVYWVSLISLYKYIRVELKHFFFTEELLIDFRELIGEHSGENMADVVWAVLMLYAITDKVNFAHLMFI